MQKIIDQMENYIRLAWKLVCMLRAYRTCNSMVRFSKYKFNNKLLSSVTLLRVTPDITWNPPYIYIDLATPSNWKKETCINWRTFPLKKRGKGPHKDESSSVTIHKPKKLFPLMKNENILIQWIAKTH